MKASVIGSPISQSKSPLIHNAAYEMLKIDHIWHYSKTEVNLKTLDRFIADVKQTDSLGHLIWGGFSVTMPLKKSVIQYLDEVDLLALKSQAVNTVVTSLKDGQVFLKGYNTDIYGIIKALETDSRYDAKNCQNYLILGNGATSKSAYLAAKHLRASNIHFAARTYKEDLPYDYDINDNAKMKSAISKSDVVISTLPWDAAESILKTYQKELNDKIVLECAFPRKLANSIDGSIMLIHQAVKQVELMVFDYLNIDSQKKDEYLNKLFNIMFQALSNAHKSQ